MHACMNVSFTFIEVHHLNLLMILAMHLSLLNVSQSHFKVLSKVACMLHALSDLVRPQAAFMGTPWQSHTSGTLSFYGSDIYEVIIANYQIYLRLSIFAYGWSCVEINRCSFGIAASMLDRLR